MNQTLWLLGKIFAALPILPVGYALYIHSWQPLGYLVWYILGMFASTTAHMIAHARSLSLENENKNI